MCVLACVRACVRACWPQNPALVWRVDGRAGTMWSSLWGSEGVDVIQDRVGPLRDAAPLTPSPAWGQDLCFSLPPRKRKINENYRLLSSPSAILLSLVQIQNTHGGDVWGGLERYGEEGRLVGCKVVVVVVVVGAGVSMG